MSPSPAKQAPKVPAAGSPLGRWRGSLPALSRRQQAAVVFASLLVIGLIGYYIVYPQCLGYYHAGKGRRALDEQDYRLARSHWERCAQAWPSDPEAQYYLARSCRGDGDLTAA